MKNRTPAPREDRAPLPGFDPVPRKAPRHDGWTPPRQRAFVEALADTGSVTRAAALVNMSTESAYQLRRQPHADSFRRAWGAALDFGALRLKDIAMDRAMTGQLVPQREGGKVVGYLRKFDNSLLMSLIRMNERSAEQRRREGAQALANAAPGKRSPSVTNAAHLTRAELTDDAAHALGKFTPVPLTDADQARITQSLAADSADRAALPRHADPAVDSVGLHEVDTPSGTPYEFDIRDADPPFREGEANWTMLHDEPALQAIDDAVASLGALPAPDPVILPKRKPDKSRRTPGISPRTGKPVRLYKARTAKPPFGTEVGEGDAPT